jgi:hypothetical protein
MLALALAVPPTLSNPPSYGPGHSLCASLSTRRRLPARPLLYPFASLSNRRRLPAGPRFSTRSLLCRPVGACLLARFSTRSLLFRTAGACLLARFSTRSLLCRPAGACLLARFSTGGPLCGLSIDPSPACCNGVRGKPKVLERYRLQILRYRVQACGCKDCGCKN